MTNEAEQREFVREAKALVALAFRNGPIEDLHAGKVCPTCSGSAEYSRITDSEMKLIMANAVNHVHRLLKLKASDTAEYERQIAFGARHTGRWADPE